MNEVIRFPYRALRFWYLKSGRHDMPWRRTRDPYRVWLSEIMLQQTTVSTVLPYYKRFLKTFPSVHSLAKAPQEMVLEKWSGLGYYARARNLHRCAQEIVRQYKGSFPQSVEELRSLPGIGRYTAGAIRSFSFSMPAPVIDGNIERVLCRYFGMAEPDAQVLWRLAEKIVPEKGARDYNLSLMDLGATVCLPRDPSCRVCPLEKDCKAHRQGVPENYPAESVRIVKKDIHLAVAIFKHQDKVLLRKFPQKGLFGGLWGFPSVSYLYSGSAQEEIRKVMRQEGWPEGQMHQLASYRRVLTHRVLHINPFLFECEKSTRHFYRNGHRRNGTFLHRRSENHQEEYLWKTISQVKGLPTALRSALAFAKQAIGPVRK